MISKSDFESLSPFDRGYAVYMAGSRDDQPNIPDEPNPYENGSQDYQDWNAGRLMAVLEIQDSDI